MFGSNRSGVIAGVAVLAGIAGLSYLLVRVAAPAAAAPPAAGAAVVEFTPDGKLKQPVGYRKWVFVGSPLTPNDLNGGEASRLPFHQEPPRQPKPQIRSKQTWLLATTHTARRWPLKGNEDTLPPTRGVR